MDGKGEKGLVRMSQCSVREVDEEKGEPKTRGQRGIGIEE